MWPVRSALLDIKLILWGVDSDQNYLSLAQPPPTMPREAEPSKNEREFILSAIQENIRLDGRALDAYRNIDLSLSDEYGVADVKLGKTR